MKWGGGVGRVTSQQNVGRVVWSVSTQLCHKQFKVVYDILYEALTLGF